MNVFDSIRGTLLSVPKGISTGILALSTQDSQREVSNDQVESGRMASAELPTEIKRDCEPNYDAGAELLSKFQNGWSAMHQRSEANARQAKVVDKKIGELFLYLRRQKDAVSLFLQEISMLPQLLHDLQSATEQIQNLEQQFEVVESELIKLEDTCEKQELQRNMRHHDFQLMAYKQRKAVELEQAKVKMAKHHASKVQQYEYNLQKGLREKQQAFEASFREEMQHYKKYGKPSKQFQIQKPSSSDVDLSNFMPDTDPADEAILNEFLQVDTASDDVEKDHSNGLNPVQASTSTSTDQQEIDGSAGLVTDGYHDEKQDITVVKMPEQSKGSNSGSTKKQTESSDQSDAT